MPQDFKLKMPFEAQDNPDSARAHRRGVEWMREFGLARSEESISRVESWNMAALAAWCWPDARDDVLDVLTDMCNVFTAQDDMLDGAVGPGSKRAREFNKHLMAALRTVNRGEYVMDRSIPLVHAWADVWSRLIARRSAAWRDRALRNHDHFWFRGFVSDADANRAQHTMALDEYDDFRVATVGILAMLDYAEFVGNFELPAWLYEHDLVQRMRRECALALARINDIASVEKDSKRGERLNTVFVLQHSSRCSLPEALGMALQLTQRNVERLDRQEKELEPMFHRLEVNARQRLDVIAYIKSVQEFLVGGYRWQQMSRRYGDQGIMPPSRARYPDDIITRMPA